MATFPFQLLFSREETEIYKLKMQVAGVNEQCVVGLDHMVKSILIDIKIDILKHILIALPDVLS